MGKAGNLPALKGGFHKSHEDGTLGLFVNGYMREMWHGKTGAHITMPAWFAGELGWDNMENPNVYVADAILAHPHGTRLEIGERVFYYATYYGKISGNVKADTVGDDLLGKGLMNFAFAQDYSNKLTWTAGTRTVVLTSTVDGTPTERVDDFYSGGWLGIKDTAPSDARMVHRYIEASTISGTTTTLTIDQPLINAITGGNSVLTPNLYKYASWYHESAGAPYYPIVGYCMVNNPTAAYGVWLQTWGPMMSAHVTNTFEGANDSEVVVYGMADGSIQVRDGSTDSYSLDGRLPIIGYTIPNSLSESGSGQDEGLPFIFLTLRR